MVSTKAVARHKTALQRYRVSKPVSLALAAGLITRGISVLDYGCGRGGDLRYLRSRRIRAEGWDPHYRPDGRLAPADVVNLSYVLNVIDDLSERAQALRHAYQLAKQLLIIGVRIDRFDGEEYGDGILTGNGTFQKIYTQDEFRRYLESILEVAPVVAAPGIAYVFKADEAKASYLASQAFSRRLEYRIDLLGEFAKSSAARRFVRLATTLGRMPLPEECRGYEKLVELFGPRERIERLTLRRVDRTAFEGAREERRADILTYLAMLRLEGLRPPPVNALPPGVREDVRALWGSYAALVGDADRFLFSIGQPEIVKATALKAGIGKLLPQDLYVHRSAVEELPTVLRVIVFAATRIIGTVDYDIAKISLDGRAVSFLSYREFDDDPHPCLLRSVRVYLPRATYSVRNYSDSQNPPILHRKDAFVMPSYSHYAKFRGLTVAEEEFGLLSEANIGYRDEWEAMLRNRGVELNGHRLSDKKLGSVEHTMLELDASTGP